MSQENYVFMKSGTSQTTSTQFNINENDLRQLLSLFISNSIINASRYAKICKRNGVTKTDINLGLKYEIREFFNRENIQQDLDEIRNDYETLKNEEPIKFRVEYTDTRTGIIETSELFNNEDDAEDFICNLEGSEFFADFTIIELTESDCAMEDMVVDDSEIQDFTKVSEENLIEASQEDRRFASKIHTYDTEWDSWEPETPILSILKNGANQMMRHTY